MHPLDRSWIWFAPLVGAVAGLGFGMGVPHNPLRLLEHGAPFQRVSTPSPHVKPRIPGGSGLRLAMIHDVLHERYLKHGSAFYRERNRLVEGEVNKAFEAKSPPSLKTLDRIDDYAAGHERLGDSARAAEIMRRKLDLQRRFRLPELSLKETIADRPEGAAISEEEYALYKTYANLGTFLIHDSARQAMARNVNARDRMRSGLDYIRKAIAINPAAHFGREDWQLAIGSFLLAAMERPELLTKYDCVGDSLATPLKDLGHLSAVTGSPTQDRRALRRVGAEDMWAKEVQTPYRQSVPFDEPILGMLGMWTMGGGANPHFSLAFGEIMLRIGQFPIAWRAYERALSMTDRFWPDPKIREFLASHCRRRQTEIRDALEWTEAEAEAERQQFQAELAFGQKAQKAYQDQIEVRIQHGVSINDPRIEANIGLDDIASPVGDADIGWIEVYPPKIREQAINAVPLAVLGAGLGMVFTLLMKRRSNRQRLESSKD